MTGRDRGGTNFHVKYRGHDTCPNFTGGHARVELHSVWDDCLVEELTGHVDPQEFAKQLLASNNITSLSDRPEVQGASAEAPWLSWGDDAHALADGVAFGTLNDGADLEDGYIHGKALDTVRQQLLAAGIRLAFLLHQNFR